MLRTTTPRAQCASVLSMPKTGTYVLLLHAWTFKPPTIFPTPELSSAPAAAAALQPSPRIFRWVTAPPCCLYGLEVEEVLDLHSTAQILQFSSDWCIRTRGRGSPGPRPKEPPGVFSSPTRRCWRSCSQVSLWAGGGFTAHIPAVTWWSAPTSFLLIPLIGSDWSPQSHDCGDGGWTSSLTGAVCWLTLVLMLSHTDNITQLVRRWTSCLCVKLRWTSCFRLTAHVAFFGSSAGDDSFCIFAV